MSPYSPNWTPQSWPYLCSHTHTHPLSSPFTPRSTATLVAGLTAISNDATRQNLAQRIDSAAGGGTCIGCGLQMAIGSVSGGFCGVFLVLWFVWWHVLCPVSCYFVCYKVSCSVSSKWHFLFCLIWCHFMCLISCHVLCLIKCNLFVAMSCVLFGVIFCLNDCNFLHFSWCPVMSYFVPYLLYFVSYVILLSVTFSVIVVIFSQYSNITFIIISVSYFFVLSRSD